MTSSNTSSSAASRLPRMMGDMDPGEHAPNERIGKGDRFPTTAVDHRGSDRCLDSPFYGRVHTTGNPDCDLSMHADPYRSTILVFSKLLKDIAMCFDNFTVSGIVISIVVVALVVMLYRSRTS
jgi:hypothetical protein